MRGRRRFLAASLVAFISFILAPPGQAQSPIIGPADAPWLVAGPFEVRTRGGLEEGLDLDFLSPYGGEGAARPSPIQKAEDLRWRQAVPQEGGIDFLKLFSEPDEAAKPGAAKRESAAPPPAPRQSVAYAYREFEAAFSRQVALKIGSDDGVKVWLNGELVLADRARRSLRPDQDAVKVRLAEGRNRILVKVDQGGGAWGFRLRFRALAEDESWEEAGVLRGLRLLMTTRKAPAGGILTGIAMTEPAFCLPAKVRISLLDPGGKRLASAEASLSEPFAIGIPPGYSGTCLLRAEGLGRISALAAASAYAIAGDAAALARSRIASARALAAARKDAPRVGAASAGESLAATTLLFLADLLDGKTEVGLETFDSAVRAMDGIAEIGRAIGAGAVDDRLVLGGLRRYAYRSALDGSLQPFSLYLPEAYDPARKYGLVVALHGQSGDDWTEAAKLAAARPADLLVLAPFGRGDLGYMSAGERDVLDAMDLVMARYAIDPDRVYLTGSSMGGFGTWRLGQLYAGRFAAIAPFAGWTQTAYLENLSNTPVLAVHGARDETVPLAPDREAAARLGELGSEIRFDILPQAGHEAWEAWTEEGGPERLLEWLRRWKRDPWPLRLDIRTSSPRYGSQSWAAVLELDRPLEPAGLRVEIQDDRHVNVETQNVAAFELDLRHPKLARTGRVLLNVDGFNLTADAGKKEARFALAGAAGDGRFASVKAAGAAIAPNLGGGLADLFSRPLYIVYGTRQKQRTESLRLQAEALADWRIDEGMEAPLGARLGRWRVVADSDLHAALSAAEGAASGAAAGAGSAPTANLILVGSPDENEVTSRIASRLPVAIEKGRIAAAGKRWTGAGMVLVCPNPEEPAALVGLVWLPMKPGPAAEFARLLVSPLRDYRKPAGLCGYATPDLLVIDGRGRTLWSASFDRDWKTLKEIK